MKMKILIGLILLLLLAGTVSAFELENLKSIENYSDLNGENSNSIDGKRHVLSNGHNLLNNAVNDKIYNIKNSVNGENAFISVLLFPTVLLFLIIIFIIINILCVVL